MGKKTLQTGEGEGEEGKKKVLHDRVSSKEGEGGIAPALHRNVVVVAHALGAGASSHLAIFESFEERDSGGRGSGEEAVPEAAEQCEKSVAAGEDSDQKHEEATGAGVDELVEAVRHRVAVVLDVRGERSEHDDRDVHEHHCSA